MNKKVEDFLTNLVNMGLSRSQVNEKTYEYALALLLEHEREGSKASAAMMAQAVELVKAAWTNIPLIPRFYEMKER
jgi:hypothetical protein